jgi:hypothetical protein
MPWRLKNYEVFITIVTNYNIWMFLYFKKDRDYVNRKSAGEFL